jgi:AcrR family transcriptional regulator
VARRTQLERRDEAETALLDAAVRLFAKKGMDGTSLADIGTEAGYSRGLVTHHFGSRAALVERLASRAVDALVGALPEEPIDVESVVAFGDMLLDRFESHTDDVRAFYVMWSTSLARDAPLREIFIAHDAHFRRNIEELVRRGQADGALRAEADAAGFGVAFVALVRGIGMQFLADSDGVDLAAARRICADLIRGWLEPNEQAYIR